MTRAKAYHPLPIAVAAGVAVLLYFLPIPVELIPRQHYFPFHVLMETFDGLLAISIFLIVWNSLKRELTGISLLLACSFLGTSLAGFMHIIAHTGLTPWATAGDLNEITYFSLISRLYAVFALLVAAFRFWPEPVSKDAKYLLLILTVGSVWSGFLLGAYRLDLLPRLAIEGMGNTLFKDSFDFILLFACVFAAVGSSRQVTQKEGTDYSLLFEASCILALSEICVAIMPQPYGKMAILGHLYKALAYWIIFRAIFISNFRAPYLKLEDSESRLFEALRLRDEFLTTAAHELRTPLTPLRAQFQLFDKELSLGRSGKPMDPARLLKYSRNIGGNIERLTRLVNNLVDVALLRSGQQLPLRLEFCSLRQILERTLERASAELVASGASVSFQASQSVNGYWDPGRMEQVLSNFLSNSIKYARGAPILIRLEEKEFGALFRYEDHGQGIPPQELTQVLEPFPRTQPQLGNPGLGLGLFTARKIIEAHGGSIEVRSVSGAGTTFIMRLPIRSASAQPLRAA